MRERERERERDSSKDSIEAVLGNKEDYNYRVAYYEEIDSMSSSLFFLIPHARGDGFVPLAPA